MSLISASSHVTTIALFQPNSLPTKCCWLLSLMGKMRGSLLAGPRHFCIFAAQRSNFAHFRAQGVFALFLRVLSLPGYCAVHRLGLYYFCTHIQAFPPTLETWLSYANFILPVAPAVACFTRVPNSQRHFAYESEMNLVYIYI